MFMTLEKPMAYTAFLFAFLTLLWKCPYIGIDWIPFGVGKAWKDIFNVRVVHHHHHHHHGSRDGDGTSSSSGMSQYPRRMEDEDFWNIVYLIMYGIFGTFAQYCGIMISSSSSSRRRRNLYPPTKTTLVRCSRIYACFHLTIAMHHIVWSLNLLKQYGKLELWRFDLPGTYLGTFFAAIGMIYQAYKIGFGQSVTLSEICYRKSVLDTTTCTTFISFVIFLLCNMLGIQTNFGIDRVLWGITIYLVPVVVLLGFVFQPTMMSDDTSKIK